MARRYALLMGIVFLLLGILGMIPGIASDGYLLGIFAVNGPHNVVHLLSGILGIAAGLCNVHRAGLMYTWFLLLAYGMVTLLGFVLAPTEGMILGFLHVNSADNWLHLIITLSALVVVVVSQQRLQYQ